MTFDSDADAGVIASVDLVNELVRRRDLDPRSAPGRLEVIGRILAVDPPSLARLNRRHVPGFVELADQLAAVFDEMHRGDVDAAAARLNGLLASHPAHPHLAKEDGRWRLHHHPVDAGLVPMWTAICAEGLARMIGGGDGGRLGTCARRGCDRAFVDQSKNASRRFCSTMCQNRVKAAAFRSRRVSPDPRS